MKMIQVTLKVPKEVDDYFRDEAKRVMISKTAAYRQILCSHVVQKKKEEKQQRLAA